MDECGSDSEVVWCCRMCGDIASLELTVEKCSRQDILFMKKVPDPEPLGQQYMHLSDHCDAWTDKENMVLFWGI